MLSDLSQWHDTIHLQKEGSEGVFVECYCERALPALVEEEDIDKITFKINIKTGLHLYARCQSHDPPDLGKTYRNLNTSYS